MLTRESCRLLLLALCTQQGGSGLGARDAGRERWALGA